MPLPMGEVAEHSEVGEGKKAAIPSQSPTVTALPKGEPRGYTPIIQFYDRSENRAVVFSFSFKLGTVTGPPDKRSANPPNRQSAP